MAVATRRLHVRRQVVMKALLRNYFFDCLLCSAAEMLAGPSHVFAKPLSAPDDAATPDASAHAFARSANLSAACLHLPLGGVVIPLALPIERDQDQGQQHRRE